MKRLSGAGFLHSLRADLSIIAKEKLRPCLNDTVLSCSPSLVLNDEVPVLAHPGL